MSVTLTVEVGVCVSSADKLRVVDDDDAAALRTRETVAEASSDFEVVDVASAD